MNVRYLLAAALSVASLSCTDSTDPSVEPIAQTSPPIASAVTGSVSIGNTTTISDIGWQRTFGGTMTVESDATLLYAVVFGGTGGSAPVTGVSVGGQAFALVKSATGPNKSSLDVYRLVAPSAGSGKSIQVTRSATGYDPVRVTLFTVKGASTAGPNGAISTLDLTPGTATATRTVTISSIEGGLTVSAVVASPDYVNGSGVTATAGYQSVVATGEDADGSFGVVGSAPGAPQVTHSWRLTANSAGRYAFLVSFGINPGTSGTTTPPPASPPPPAAPAGSATFGTVATFSDNGWSSTFGGTMQVEGDATLMYAVVFNGTGGNAPVSGVSVGGRAFTRIKSAERTANASLDVFRLAGVPTGAQQVSIARSRLGYDPVRVSVFTVRNANASNPNGPVTETDLTPGSAIITRSIPMASTSDGLTISAVAASGTFANGNGVTATPGYQTTRATGEDPDGLWGVLGSAPGAASVTHSWNLRADAAGRSIYAVTFSVNGASGSPPPPPPPPPPPTLPVVAGGWTTVLDYDFAQPVPLWPGAVAGWSAYERPLEKMLYSNLAFVQDGPQPGNTNAGASRIWFHPSLPGGYAPIHMNWGGTWPANTGSLDVTFTIKLADNWDNNGPNNTNGGTKLMFFGKFYQDNHFIGIESRRYDGSEGGGPANLGGAWVMVGLQNPTATYKTNVSLTRGVWHTVRVQIVSNTPGVKNGQLRIWVDGTQALVNSAANDQPRFTERTDVLFRMANQVASQERLQFEPTYGHGHESPPYSQWMEFGHVTAAIK